MATTSIWDVKDNLKRVLDYTSNPNKTEALSDEDYHFNGLNQAIIYTTNDLKTEKQQKAAQLVIDGLARGSRENEDFDFDAFVDHMDMFLDHAKKKKNS